MTTNSRGDMSAFAENFPHEDFFMQQARKNGAEVGAPDPTVGVGGLINFMVGLISAKSIVEIGTGSGVSGLWIFNGAPKDATFTSIDSEREHSASAKEILEDPACTLKWVARRHPEKEHRPVSRVLGLDRDEGIFVAENLLCGAWFKANKVDVIIDFSHSTASRHYSAATSQGVRIVSAVSKYEPEDRACLTPAACWAAVLHSPNITLGINCLMHVAKLLRRIIPEADIEIIEEHFRNKKETSGTALKMAESLGLNPETQVNSIRVGGIVGRHEIIFGLPFQTLRLVHDSVSRSAFGRGAIFAAKWLVDQEPGLYTMEQMINEKFSQAQSLADMDAERSFAAP